MSSCVLQTSFLSSAIHSQLPYSSSNLLGLTCTSDHKVSLIFFLILSSDPPYNINVIQTVHTFAIYNCNDIDFFFQLLNHEIV